MHVGRRIKLLENSYVTKVRIAGYSNLSLGVEELKRKSD